MKELAFWVNVKPVGVTVTRPTNVQTDDNVDEVVWNSGMAPVSPYEVPEKDIPDENIPEYAEPEDKDRPDSLDYGEPYQESDIGNFGDVPYNPEYDRESDNIAKEALRRSRQVQEAVGGINDRMDQMLNMMQTTNVRAADDIEVEYSAEDTELINQAFAESPAEALKIMQQNILRTTQKHNAQLNARNNDIIEAKRAVERDVGRMFPAMRNPQHPYHKAVVGRFNEMKQDYARRGVDPNSVPELIRYAAMEVAANNPALAEGNNRRPEGMRDRSRQRRADMTTQSSTTRSNRQQPSEQDKLTAKQASQARRMGIDISDPKAVQSILASTSNYNRRRRV